MSPPQVPMHQIPLRREPATLLLWTLWSKYQCPPGVANPHSSAGRVDTGRWGTSTDPCEPEEAASGQWNLTSPTH